MLALYADDTFAACEAFREKTGAVFIHPFNNDTVIAGQGTIGLEIVEDAEKQLGKPLDAVLVPIGGGGIAAGLFYSTNLALNLIDNSMFRLAQPLGFIT